LRFLCHAFRASLLRPTPSFAVIQQSHNPPPHCVNLLLQSPPPQAANPLILHHNKAQALAPGRRVTPRIDRRKPLTLQGFSAQGAKRDTHAHRREQKRNRRPKN
jgi:hypothetical protein